jgi:hypothetical protein
LAIAALVARGGLDLADIGFEPVEAQIAKLAHAGPSGRARMLRTVSWLIAKPLARGATGCVRG